MRVIYLLLSFMLCFCPVMQAQNTTNQFMKQAQSSLEKKDYTKARYLFLQAYKSLSNKVITNRQSMPVRRRLIYIIARIITKRHSIFAAR